MTNNKSKVNFTGKYVPKSVKVFMIAYRIAFTKSVEHIFSKCFEYAPVGKTRSGPVNLRNALKWDFDWDKNEGMIGVPQGSEMEKIAFYVEMGTGERGQKGWRQWFDEKVPQFTVPIVPIKAKALHFVNESGKHIFMKQSKGQRPQSFMRRAFYDSKSDVDKIWKKAFSNNSMRSIIKYEKI